MSGHAAALLSGMVPASLLGMVPASLSGRMPASLSGRMPQPPYWAGCRLLIGQDAASLLGRMPASLSGRMPASLSGRMPPHPVRARRCRALLHQGQGNASRKNPRRCAPEGGTAAPCPYHDENMASSLITLGLCRAAQFPDIYRQAKVTAFQIYPRKDLPH